MGGRLVNVMQNIRGQVGVPVGWSLQSFPRPDPDKVDDREKVIATERMLWRSNATLAADVGKPYAIEDEPLLITEAEWTAQEMAAANPTPPPKPRAAPKTRKR